MPYLVSWDATCWEAGSLVPSEREQTTLISTKEAAVARFRRVLKSAERIAMHDVAIILANPNQFEFNSGYSYFAIVIEVPRTVQSVDAATIWLAETVDSGGSEAIHVVSVAGVNISPPGGKKSPIPPTECLESFLEYLR